MGALPFELRRLGGTFGAEVVGLDLAEVDETTPAALHDAFVEHAVLVFRGQKLAPEQQIAFGERFGELHVHPIVPHLEGYPPILPIVNLGKKYTITETWHSDVTFEPRPPMASMLYAKTVPAAGGDTQFADQRAAYDRLSEGMKRMLAGLRAVHVGADLAKLVGRRGRHETHPQAVPTAVHPVVRTHPVSGRKALFVNAAFTRHLEHMTPEESAPLLRFLYRFGTAPDLTIRHRWQPDDLVMWDNRSVQHYAIHDHGDAERTLHRVTVMGDAPF